MHSPFIPRIWWSGICVHMTHVRLSKRAWMRTECGLASARHPVSIPCQQTHNIACTAGLGRRGRQHTHRYYRADFNTVAGQKGTTLSQCRYRRAHRLIAAQVPVLDRHGAGCACSNRLHALLPREQCTNAYTRVATTLAAFLQGTPACCARLRSSLQQHASYIPKRCASTQGFFASQQVQ